MNKIEAIEVIKSFGLVNGSRVYVKTDSVSKSGMSRAVSVFVPVIDKGELFIKSISWFVAPITGQKLDKNGNIKLHGCGMDMHYWLVSELAREMGLTLEKVTL